MYSAKSGLALVCAITNQVTGYPFEVAVLEGHGASGVILADHLKSLHRKARPAERFGRCPLETLEEIRARLAPLLGY